MGGVELHAQTTLAGCDCQMTPTAGYDFNGNTSVTDLTQPINFTNRKIRIRTTFTINGDITFDNCCVKLDPGASIIVQSGKTLSINNSSFFGCGNLWNQVLIDANGAINATQTEFKDAESAISFRPSFSNSKTKISGCHFVNNRVGVGIGTNSVSPLTTIVFLPNVFGGNTFEGAAEILPSIGNTVKNVSEAGMKFVKCADGKVLSLNVFNKLKVGILAIRSTIEVSNQNFDHMFGTQVLLTDGTGIIADRTRLTVKSCNFTNNSLSGIFSNNSMNLVVSDCQFDHNKRFGIQYANAPSSAKLQIKLNRFEMDQTDENSAISVSRPPGPLFASDTDGNIVQLNTINVSGAKTNTHPFDAIFIDATLGGSNFLTVIQNTITSTHTAGAEVNAIKVIGLQNVASNGIGIIQNTISYPNLVDNGLHQPLTRALGIAVANLVGNNNSIHRNKITSNLTLAQPNSEPMEDQCSNIKCAIHVVTSADMVICNNTTDQTARGFHFGGDVGFCQFADNHIGKHLDGFIGTSKSKLNSTSKKTLKFHDNIWGISTDYLRSGARNELDGIPAGNGMPGTPAAITTPLYRFFVDQALNSAFMPPKLSFVPFTGNPPGWFLNVTQGNIKTTAPDCIGITLEPTDDPNRNLSNEDSLLMTGNTQGMTGRLLWDTERNILRKLILNSSMHPFGSLEDNYLNHKTGTSSYKYANTEASLGNTFNIPETWIANLKVLEATQKLWSDSLFKLNTVVQTPNIFQAGLNVTAVLSNLNDDIKLVDDQIGSFTYSQLAILLVTIPTLPQNQIWESNLKSILHISTRKLLGESISISDNNLLLSIGNQCQEEGGEMVLGAANWLPYEEMTKHFGCDFANPCIGNQLQIPIDRSVTDISRDDFQLLLNPNPANDLMLVKFSREIGSGECSIYNMDGKQIDKSYFKNGDLSLFISTQSFLSGVYYLVLHPDIGQQRTIRFVVTH